MQQVKEAAGGVNEIKWHVVLNLTPEQIRLVKHKSVSFGIPTNKLVKDILLMCLEQNLIIGEQ